MMLQKLKQSLHLLAPASILSQTEFGKLTGKFSLKALDVDMSLNKTLCS